MTDIPLTRCQFLIPFVDIYTEIGAPTAKLLARFRLPTSLEEKAEHYVPVLPAVSFAETAQQLHGITDVGFRVTKRLQFRHLSEKLKARVKHAPTLLTALQQVCKWAPLEDTVLNVWLEPCGDTLRVCSRLAGTAGARYLEHSQWVQNVLLIHVVREFAGPAWSPATIAFEAHYTPGLDTQCEWPNTRFLSGQSASWIDVPVADLALPNIARQASLLATDEEFPQFDNGLIEALKLMMPSYLNKRAPNIEEVAEIAGMSVRSFQRKLSHAGQTYSSLLDQVRFENAARLLRDTDARIVDVAFSSGYSDAAHFTRAFRRIAGVTPRDFRSTARPRSIGRKPQEIRGRS